ncbi:nucleoside phosphorylase [Xanthobacter oligotrophicus]|uniref:nucleoside phosphorylase n=1 Tax=Xanthobacter oligotrophicus TaxID=2607286 RepID=UPI001AED548A|nr:nucleoside phosphorylase [Xanthobacter oligotrophicus]MCG5237843.1 nucleoside phosphorylase [Xanthobacter oligotrophicus]
MLLKPLHEPDDTRWPVRSPLPSGFLPLIERADHRAPSVFRPENMMREARRQKGLAAGPVPRIVLLDPDGDMVDYVRTHRAARRSSVWACYHTDMWEWEEEGLAFGVVGYAVGSSFSVLVAEQAFVCGCELLISIASAGQIADHAPPSYHVLIDRALRDEGTSYHYLPAAPFAAADPDLIAMARRAFAHADGPVLTGATWTTDAPFRETEAAIARRKAEGLLAVEMEAAALYAFARAQSRPVLCLAHVTNQLGCVDGDFEKGDHNGACRSIALAAAFALAWDAHAVLPTAR